MSEQIITKRCCKCKQIKSLNEFYSDSRNKDKHVGQCKVCRLHYFKRYRKTIGYKIATTHYRKTKKYKATHRNYSYQYAIQRPEYKKATRAINNAVLAGKVPKIDTLQCYLCFKPAQHYHHYLGYEPQYNLEVLPICISCHKKLHRKLISISN